ncbi:MAG: ATP-dependent protease [Candidatus Tokpelaia sp.]|uniref:LON peptidase substrate-binding domain-containing protein n=1 Tax=Candidatus Tokpelaia sp. TaxID=2233777 RepID=UPI00123A386A|nr:LON peptidase substrate-binding domain-containing protein [Candidatus Tokpelaia sp.]KAA6205510.1 MAG: ATP-dependent protease [Candidatus Tokpelaia sp.]KAA6206216.1 MAG: ATP-dependent protease [Candidatus Tokpelaia sp.]KAA6406044.1 ATP-dependent protease [Candidatus Tokpelaia sp.]
MQAGNAFYTSAQDIPQCLPVLSMASIMLMPGGFVPLTLSEPRFIQMVDDAMRGDRLIGLVLVKSGNNAAKAANYDPLSFDADLLHKYQAANDNNATWNIGCIGRITHYSEVGDGQIMISLHGICRFRLEAELQTDKPYRQYAITPFIGDLGESDDNAPIDREMFLSVFQDYLAANHMQADWDIIAEVSNSALVNALSTIVPFAPAEKQALLEAPDIKTRSETMIAIAQRSMLRDGKYGQRMVQ